ncbi:SDR family NAD(P)-dependent oxidoreductase [Acidimangrovimonas sediminis]|uniref:SDR family NAD(P)-dependent oxidoreductase n=1 Tax=Acidimangrovimonas sediminis TaxID=2056283 RepID=UPI0018EBBC50|nr:SDR family NAD(P)-dependent oxidoreductase [Acidimangrovimonas sediminis]
MRCEGTKGAAKGTAMISGANRGIGLAVARALGAAGYRLSLGVRDPSALPGDLAPFTALTFAYDAGRPADARAWVASTAEVAGGIDVLVNNAGISTHLGLMEDPALDDEEAEARLDALLSVNIKAPFLVTRAALPHLCRSGRGRVITLASMSGKRVLGLNAGYQVTKHAAVALSNAARRTGWDHGVRATAICPSFVATDMALKHDELNATEITQPEDLARLVVEMVALPNTATVAELLVNWRYEAGF